VAQSLRIGAGGRWLVFDEKPESSVVKQQSNVSCGPACGEMLFQGQGTMMKVQVLEIKTKRQTHIFKVNVLVGKCLYTLPVEVQEAKIGDYDGLIANSDKYAWETLQYNARVIGKIYRLVLEVYSGGEVSLPATITEHLALSPILAGQTVHADIHNGSRQERLQMKDKILAG